MSLFIYLGYFWLTVGIFNERASYSLLKWCGNSHESIIILSSDGVSGLLFCLYLSSHWKHSYSTTHVILITCLTSPYFSTMPWHIFLMFVVVVTFMDSPEKHTAILCLISLLFFSMGSHQLIKSGYISVPYLSHLNLYFHQVLPLSVSWF